jgi:hypothetical protein
MSRLSQRNRFTACAGASLLLVALSSGAAHAEDGPGTAALTGETATEHFRVRYTARAEGTARELAERVETVRGELEALVGHPWPGTTEIRIGVGRDEMESLSPAGKPPTWAAALAFPDRHVVLLEARTLLGPDGLTLLRHEMCHAALGALGGPWPRWFHEGLAMRLAGETRGLSQYTTLYRSVSQDRLFRFEDLANGWPEQRIDVEIAYAQSASFVGFLVDRHGPARFDALLDGVHAGEPFERAFGKAFHSSLDAEEADWRLGLRGRYTWAPIITGEAMIWLFITCIFLAAYWKRRVGLARWHAAQAALEATEEAAWQEPEREPIPEVPPDPTFH